MKSSPSRMKAMRHSALSIRSAMRSDSNTTTPQSSAYPSAYPTEDESEDNVRSKKRQPFRFLDLPSELRNKVYGIAFESTPPVIDLDPDVFHILRRIFPLLFVSKQIHAEVAHYFYSTYTFRVFPIHPGRHFKTKKPLLARLTPECRSSITTLELRLGPGWNNPPRGWIVNEALGLKDCLNVRVLKIFVECDPSDAIFKGFRRSEGFYETFSQRLLEEILKDVPSIKVVEFDGWSSVKKDGDMVAGLLEAVLPYGKITTWGKESGWVDDDERQRLVDSALVKAGAGNNVVTRSIAILA